MPIFAVPIVSTSTAPRSRRRFSSLPIRNKRKRATSRTSSDSESEDDGRSQNSRSEAAASTNPLSLTPAEVVQYRLAGLELDERIPRTKAWPHRGLPAERTDTGRRRAKVDIERKSKKVMQRNESDDESARTEDGDDEERVEVGDEDMDGDHPPPRLRLQHLEVLTAIVQRCLLEGDIPRASRAWAMLLRVQVGGHAMDLRASGYWAIGAELLMRSGEKPIARKQRLESDTVSDEEAEENQEREQEHKQDDKTRYGTASGLAKVKEYYEKLIVQHPYNRHWKDSVSALDFWPAMVGCEIYGIQYELEESLRAIALDEENESQDEDALESPSDIDSEISEGADFNDVEERRNARSRQRKAEKKWQKRDEIRKIALGAYGKVAARLDDLLTTLPYSDSCTMLRLRAMLALCVGDLLVPLLPPVGEEDLEDGDGMDRNRRTEGDEKDTEHLLLRQHRLAEHERAKWQQREEHIRARQLFERIERLSGRTEPVTSSLPREQDTSQEL